LTDPVSACGISVAAGEGFSSASEATASLAGANVEPGTSVGNFVGNFSVAVLSVDLLDSALVGCCTIVGAAAGLNATTTGGARNRLSDAAKASLIGENDRVIGLLSSVREKYPMLAALSSEIQATVANAARRLAPLSAVTNCFESRGGRPAEDQSTPLAGLLVRIVLPTGDTAFKSDKRR
jgi:hypothetical protein